MKREQLVNKAETTLDGAITDSDLTATLTDGSIYPADGDYRLVLGTEEAYEVVKVTARSSNDVTIVRGQDDTSAVAWPTGTIVRAIASAEGLLAFALQNVHQYANYSPAFRLYGITDQIIADADFTWINQGTATSADLNGGLRMKIANAAGADVKVKVLTAPSPPYVMTAAFELFTPAIAVGTGQPRAGLTFRESSTGELVTFWVRRTTDALGDQSAPGFIVDHYTNPTSFAGEQHREAWWTSSGLYWLRIEDDNTDLNFSLSPDGVEWREIYTNGRTVLMAGGPDQVGLAMNSSSAGDEMWMTVHHLSFD